MPFSAATINFCLVACLLHVSGAHSLSCSLALSLCQALSRSFLCRVRDEHAPLSCGAASLRSVADQQRQQDLIYKAVSLCLVFARASMKGYPLHSLCVSLFLCSLALACLLAAPRRRPHGNTLPRTARSRVRGLLRSAILAFPQLGVKGTQRCSPRYSTERKHHKA